MPLFMQYAAARKADSIPWDLIKNMAKVGRYDNRKPDVETMREILKSVAYRLSYGIGRNKFRAIRKEVKWHKENGYRLVP